MITIALQGITCQASIGIFDWEKAVLQQLEIDIRLEALVPRAPYSDNLDDTVDYKALTALVITVCQSQHYGLLERLIDRLGAEILAFDDRIVSVDLTLHKKGAVRHARNVSVACTKHRHQVIIGIGSNLEPQKHVKEAIDWLKSEFELAQTSAWLTTKAIARPRDPDYINTAVLIRTGLEKETLVRRLKHIEYEMGREYTSNDAYAPRIIDLDLMLYNDRIIDADLCARDFLQTLIEQLSPGMSNYLADLYAVELTPKTHESC